MYLWVVSKGKHAGDGIDLLHAALVVEMLLSIRLEPIFVVVKVDQMAPPQLGHVLEEVLHVEADLATAPIAAPGTVKADQQGENAIAGATAAATCSWSSLCRRPSCRRTTSGCSGTDTPLAQHSTATQQQVTDAQWDLNALCDATCEISRLREVVEGRGAGPAAHHASERAGLEGLLQRNKSGSD